MPVARIVTPQDVHESGALNGLSEQLRAAGYQVEIVPPGTENSSADLVIELAELSPAEALEAAARLASKADADFYVAPGLLTSLTVPAQPAADLAQEPEPRRRDAPAGEQQTLPQESVIGSTLEDVGAALAEGRAGVRDAVLRLQARAGQVWSRWQQQRAQRAQQSRLEGERREMKREERRRQHEFELQRQAEEKQQLLAERERLAAERERALREQMAREAALRAEHERVEREAMAKEALRRAELAHAEAEERRREIAVHAERMRELREQQARRTAALEAERLRLEQEQAARRAAAMPELNELIPAPAAEIPEPFPLAEPVAALAAPARVRRPARRNRRVPSRRERQWQQAAFIASIATLAAMLGFALAANMHRGSPLPASLIHNRVQQQVPFGPAKIVPAAADATAAPSASVASTGPKRAAASVKTSASKPTPAVPARRSTVRRPARDSDIAEDEVIIHHFPRSSTERAQTRAGVRHITDDN